MFLSSQGIGAAYYCWDLCQSARQATSEPEPDDTYLEAKLPSTKGNVTGWDLDNSHGTGWARVRQKIL